MFMFTVQTCLHVSSVQLPAGAHVTDNTNHFSAHNFSLIYASVRLFVCLFADLLEKYKNTRDMFVDCFLLSYVRLSHSSNISVHNHNNKSNISRTTINYRLSFSTCMLISEHTLWLTVSATLSIK